MKKKSKEHELKNLKYEFAQEMGITDIPDNPTAKKNENKNNSK
ncbi:hypothetical protein SAMN00017405_0048 [Desulfonispora thiosulfatigenes DSM 11270]|uniref:Small, acid-soluble spore protein, alpha/beta type n=1 Tax=Desulfonispora thiosulfatigenes DSM 11270 TaxID=656914 RepID=A0A1W1VJN0_DESTI|nr:hypothetical protein [Desulfonispora thiosulfatigenes]SMB93538.1 hypothetical protein SAMN00017405_0048 [Desulfonispora thiosulfatigenes DSM 11270]